MGGEDVNFAPDTPPIERWRDVEVRGGQQRRQRRSPEAAAGRPGGKVVPERSVRSAERHALRQGFVPWYRELAYERPGDVIPAAVSARPSRPRTR